jgi:lipopolysaccharide transport system ATP-binding protein
MSAIRISHLGRFFDPPLALKNAGPGQVARVLLRMLGVDIPLAPSDDIHRTATSGGQVLTDISLEIEPGTVVCLAGATGSGKSTLLKILACVIPPTEGRIELRGTVRSLLRIGDNLDGRLTAIENIDRQRPFTRMPDAEAAGFAAAVIDFAGLAGIEQVPVRTYSTGMTLRLSIAMALHGRPSILLVDDVLGVGDIAFQQQCIDRLHELSEQGCTMVLAFSDDDLVRQIASRVVTLAGGRVTGDAPPTEMILGQHGFGATDVAWHITPKMT